MDPVTNQYKGLVNALNALDEARKAKKQAVVKVFNGHTVVKTFNSVSYTHLTLPTIYSV